MCDAMSRGRIDCFLQCTVFHMSVKDIEVQSGVIED
jgi:hypothetical protein